MVASASSHDDVFAGCHGFVVGNFRIGIGQSKHNRIGRHGANHVLRHNVALAQTHKNVGATHGFLQRFELRIHSKKELVVIEVGTARTQSAL